ncbi:retron Eco8 family effector endonuclease [Marinimicrobium sp. C6131]|uniref:retron Eco8 family effector endonuclease n=1 Tax=Marinimicrobium sp. C6131 TaxID=3022676 RepID=UPI00223DD9DC|nr:retron Eco8 family effector endonuclease [Marinimicrobium sp. C6131]UZJ44771.1 retron Eco8 family effector endonuclease [Marinimicrobium sp. C6131]
MSLVSVEVKNLLSFEHVTIRRLSDINCIVGENNVGKSNFLKLLTFFYQCLGGEMHPPPSLNSNYSSFGEVSLKFDLERIARIVTAEKNRENKFFRHIYNVLRDEDPLLVARGVSLDHQLELTLKVSSNRSVVWSIKNDQLRKIIYYLFPFFYVSSRHMSLHNWDDLWYVVSRLRSFGTEKVNLEEIRDFFDNMLSSKSGAYKEYIQIIQSSVNTSSYDYREKLLNFVKAGLDGQEFIIDGMPLNMQSDGTNSYGYIYLFLDLIISLTRRDYVNPVVFIDEPEIGLHPKLNEELIENLSKVYYKFKKTKVDRELGRYATPYPTIFFATHSPNIIKKVIVLFKDDQKVFHFWKSGSGCTRSKEMVSRYSDRRFVNIFSDNEARLFFSKFILFVEGETEIEIFSNLMLKKVFPFCANIDVYKFNSVTLGALNPSYSSASVPFLVLYDLDKIFSFDCKNKKINFRNEVADLKALEKKYMYSYYGSEEYGRNIDLSGLKRDFSGGEVKFGSNGLVVDSVSGSSYDEMLNRTNKFFTDSCRFKFTRTTVEHILVSEYSLRLLLGWLKFHVSSNFVPRKNRIIPARKIYHKEGVQSIVKVFNIAFGGDGELVEDDEFTKFIKRQYIILVVNLCKSFETRKECATALRLLVGGKSESLISLKSSSYGSFVAKDFRDKFDELKNVLSPLSFMLQKTGGWVTLFLDYSISSLLERTKDKSEFYDKFRFYFKDFYDILRSLRS